MKRMYSFRFDPALIERVDGVKGDGSRTLYLERALEKAVAEKDGGDRLIMHVDAGWTEQTT